MGFDTYLTVECHLSTLTVQAYLSDVRGFQEFSGSGVVSKPMLIGYLSQLNDRQYTKASIQRKISAIRLYLGYLKRTSQPDVPDISDLFQPSPSLRLPTLMSAGALRKILTFPYHTMPKGSRNRLMIWLLYYGGCRVSEVVSLKAGYLFSDHIQVVGKGRKTRMIPISQPLKQALDDYQSSESIRQSPWVFPGLSGQHVSRQLVSSVVGDVVQACGIKDRITPHTFRHMFATQLLEKGLDLREVQLLLGHSSIQTTQIYTHLDTSKLKRTFNTCHPLS